MSAEMLALLVGVMLPPVVDKVNRAHWPGWAKLTAAFGASAVVGTLTAWSTGDLTSAGGWWGAVTAAFVASQVAYRTWWHRKPADIEES